MKIFSLVRWISLCRCADSCNRSARISSNLNRVGKLNCRISAWCWEGDARFENGRPDATEGIGFAGRGNFGVSSRVQDPEISILNDLAASIRKPRSAYQDNIILRYSLDSRVSIPPRKLMTCSRPSRCVLQLIMSPIKCLMATSVLDSLLGGGGTRT